MRFGKFILVLVLGLLIASAVYAADPVAAITQPNTSGIYISPAATAGSYVINWTLVKSDFNTSEDAYISLRLAKAPSAGSSFVNEIIVSSDTNAVTADVNADLYCTIPTAQRCGAAGATATSCDYNTAVPCSYTWSAVSGAADGNYYVDVNFSVQQATNEFDTNDSGAYTFYLDQTAPSAPTDFTVTDFRAGQVRLDWKSATNDVPLDFNKYTVLKSSVSFSSCTSTSATEDTNITDHGDTTHFIQMDTNGIGKSAYFCVYQRDRAQNLTASSIGSVMLDRQAVGTSSAAAAQALAQQQAAQQAVAGSANASSLIALASTPIAGFPAWLILAVGAIIYFVFIKKKGRGGKKKGRGR